MEKESIKRMDTFNNGYTALSEIGGKNGDMLMDYGVLSLKKGQEWTDRTELEKAYLLVQGEVEFCWDGEVRRVSRSDCFNELPYVLHLPKSKEGTIRCISDNAEVTVSRTENEMKFDPKFYEPGMYEDEYRGKGLMGETSTRIVREVFGYKTAPYSKMVLGEVIGFPGKWSSYPPHHHHQPEIYYYKTLPENGFGFCDLGDEVLKVTNNDTVFIRDGQIHPHVTAPGYALWYLWVIRHLDDDPYITPTFVDEHKWVTEPNAHIWQGPKQDK